MSFFMVRVEGLEPPWKNPLVPKTSASTNSATPAIFLYILENTQLVNFFNYIFLIFFNTFGIISGKSSAINPGPLSLPISP